MSAAISSRETVAQLEAFQAGVKAHIAWLSVTPANSSRFSGMIKHKKFGFLDFVRVDCEPIRVERTMSHIASDKNSDFSLAVQLEGEGKARQIGREVTLQPGDFTIIDSRMPYALEFTGPVKRLVMRLPREELTRRGGVTQNVCCRAYRGTTGTSALASNMAISVERLSGAVEPMLHQTLAATLLDLILFSQAEDMEEGAGLSSSNGATLQRLRAVVLAHLSDPDLSSERVAELAGISVRYVHKLFSGTGISLNRWIQEERLASCHRCLSNPAHNHRSITEIALSSGFNDSGYFSHLFSKRFGVSPSKLRSRAR